jgi:(S)-6-hydroxynicotine oxidase
MDYDVIIVGAGYAGITAARDLTERGASVLILEARDRVGGRAWSDRLEGTDHVVELGATWIIRDLQPNVAREIARYGIETMPGSEVDVENAIFVTGGERRTKLPVPIEEMLNLEQVWLRTIREASRISTSKPIAAQPVADLDVTIADFFAPLNLPTATRDLVYAYSVLMGGAHPERTSSLSTLEKISAYGQSIWSLHGTLSERFANGSEELAEAMLESTRAKVRLSTPVTSVAQTDESVTVTTSSGDVFTAGACIFTGPRNAPVFEKVEFDPPLSQAKRRFIEAPNEGLMYKINMIVENVPPGLFCIGWGGPLMLIFSLAEVSPGRYLMTGFGTKHAYELDPNDPEAAQAAVRYFVPDARVVSTRAHDWVDDPWSGGVTEARGAGLLHQRARTLDEPEGRIFLAGTDLAGGAFHGWIEGAIDSGRVVADRVSVLLAVRDHGRRTATL